MGQRTKKIDLLRSYLPIDPNTLPVTMHDTQQEDAPEDRIPVIPFEGWNFMPTSYGWRSYFGISSNLDVSALALPARCREIFTFQKTDLTHFLVALCDSGIWTKSGETVGVWTQEIVLVDAADGILREWSSAILENALYVYRQGEAKAYKCLAPLFTFTDHIPNTLNMAGQIGLFKAGGRLGFWDSADSIGNSSFTDFTDFVPSVATLANIWTLKEKIGKIITCVQHGEGFIVYATKSIIGVTKDLSNTFLWKTKVISNIAGVAYRRQVALGSPDSEHYAWTSIGLMRIRNFEAEIVTPELYDFLKEAQDPVYLKVLEGRYLALQLVNVNYVNGILSFYTQSFEGVTITLAEAYVLWGSMPNPVVTSSMEDSDARLIYDLFQQQPAQTAVESEEGGCLGIGYCTGKDYGVYTDKFIVPVSPIAQLLELNKSGEQATFDSLPITLFGKTQNIGSIAQPIGEAHTVLAGVPVTSKDYTGNLLITSANERNFYDKVTAIWTKYNTHLLGYIRKLRQQLIVISPKLVVTNALETSTVSVVADIPTYIVSFGVVGAGIIAAETMYVTADATITMPAGTNGYVGRIPYDFETEYGKTGYTYYAINKPTRQLSYSAILTKGISKLTGPFQIDVLGRSGSGVAVPAGLQPADPTIGDALSDFHFVIATAGLTITGRIISNDTIANFIRSGVAAVQAGFAGLTVLDTSGAAWAPSDDGWLVTYTVEDAGLVPGSVDFIMRATGIQGTDDLAVVYTDDVLADAYCAREQHISYTHPTSFFRYNLLGGIIASPNVPPAYSEAVVLAASLCGQGLSARPRPSLFNMSISPPNSFADISVVIENVPYIIQQGQAVTFTFPGASFLMQSGSPAPYLALWKGAYVYDTHLQRWGKMKQDYYQLLDFSPINSTAYKTLDFSQFGLQAAMLDADGFVRVFDSKPSESYLKFGKYGNYRHGFTSLEKVRADFRQPCSGSIEVEASLDGRTVNSTNTRSYPYSAATQLVQGHGLSARWHNVGFRGNFDLCYLELTSWPSSRR